MLTWRLVSVPNGAVALTAEAGGNVLVGKSPANEGNYFAALQDPYGAVFAVFEGSYDD